MALQILLSACGQATNAVDQQTLELIGGQPSELTAVAALVDTSTAPSRVHCTATLVAERFALTAAHCVAATESGSAPPQLWFTSSLLTDGDQGPRVAVSHIYLAPGFATDNAPPTELAAYHDLALVELSEPPAGIEPIPIVAPYPAAELLTVDRPVVLVGYGRSVAGDSTTTGTRQQGSNAISAVGDAEILVDSPEGAQPCIGDSGGPILGLAEGTGGASILLAVTSRSGADCTLGAIGTRVDVELDWIRNLAALPCGSGGSEPCVREADADGGCNVAGQAGDRNTAAAENVPPALVLVLVWLTLYRLARWRVFSADGSAIGRGITAD